MTDMNVYGKVTNKTLLKALLILSSSHPRNKSVKPILNRYGGTHL